MHALTSPAEGAEHGARHLCAGIRTPRARIPLNNARFVCLPHVNWTSGEVGLPSPHNNLYYPFLIFRLYSFCMSFYGNLWCFFLFLSKSVSPYIFEFKCTSLPRFWCWLWAIPKYMMPYKWTSTVWPELSHKLTKNSQYKESLYLGQAGTVGMLQ